MTNLRTYVAVLLAATTPTARGQQEPIPAEFDLQAPQPLEPQREPPRGWHVVDPRNALDLSDRRDRGLLIRPDINLLRASNTGSRIVFDLEPGRSFVGIVEAIEHRTRSSFSTRGTLEDLPGSSWLLAVEQDAVAGVISAPTASLRYTLKYLKDGIHSVGQPPRRPDTHCGGSAPRPPGLVMPDTVPEADEAIPLMVRGRPQGGGADACTPPTPVFDGMIVYTNVARAAAGGVNAINAQCQAAVDATNLAYLRSRVDAHFRLVWRGEVQYDENGTYSQHLTRLSTAWGPFAAVLMTRDQVNADFCSLLVDDWDADGTVGIAWCGGNGFPEILSVVNWDLSASDYVLAHEVGHNQGCAHNPENAGGGCGAFSDSYGHRFTVGQERCLTVMSYYFDSQPYGTQIGYFSNPDVMYLGEPTGTPGRRNAATIQSQRAACEALQTTRMDIWLDSHATFPQSGTFAYPFASVGQGLSNIQTPGAGLESGNLYLKAGSYVWRGTVNQRLQIRACGGAVQIGQ